MFTFSLCTFLLFYFLLFILFCFIVIFQDKHLLDWSNLGLLDYTDILFLEKSC